MHSIKIIFWASFVVMKFAAMDGEVFTPTHETASDDGVSNSSNAAYRSLEQSHQQLLAQHQQLIDRVQALENRQMTADEKEGRTTIADQEMSERQRILQQKQELANKVNVAKRVQETSERQWAERLNMAVESMPHILQIPEIEAVLNENIGSVANVILENISGSDMVSMYKNPAFIGSKAFDIAYDMAMNKVMTMIEKRADGSLPYSVKAFIKKSFKSKIMAAVKDVQDTLKSIDDIDPSMIGPWGVES